MLGTVSEMRQVLRDMRTRRDARIFRVSFVKRTNGEVRNMVCRFGVRPRTEATRERPYDPAAHDLLTVFDMQAREYRNIALDAILGARIAGIGYGVLRTAGEAYALAARASVAQRRAPSVG